MKLPRFTHSALLGRDPNVPPKLKPFNSLTGKLSSILWKGALVLAATTAVLSLDIAAADASGIYLRRGMAGPEVARLQSALGIRVDGLFGPQTKSAVISFQRSCGLQVDGVAGPQTLSALYSGTCHPGSVAVVTHAAPVSTSTSCNPCCPSSAFDSGFSLQPRCGRYVVVIPGNEQELLSQVRRFIPGAFLDATNAGPFVNAGEFDNISDATRISNRLRGVGFDARVEYIGIG
jgi:peptidoglycan hydrolase-like protein with peptidoglycan-binding domain